MAQDGSPWVSPVVTVSCSTSTRHGGCCCGRWPVSPGGFAASRALATEHHRRVSPCATERGIDYRPATNTVLNRSFSSNNLVSSNARRFTARAYHGQARSTATRFVVVTPSTQKRYCCRRRHCCWDAQCRVIRAGTSRS